VRLGLPARSERACGVICIEDRQARTRGVGTARGRRGAGWEKGTTVRGAGARRSSHEGPLATPV
jgi:hypothetical protein